MPEGEKGIKIHKIVDKNSITTHLLTYEIMKIKYIDTKLIR